MKRLALTVFAALALMFPLIPASAHHGDAGRYDEAVITITGSVLELQWVDPHAVLVLDVPNDKGVIVRWQAELGGRTALARSGWTKNTLKQGDKVTLTGRKVKSGAPYMNLTERANVVLTSTGKELFRTPNFGEPAK